MFSKWEKRKSFKKDSLFPSRRGVHKQHRSLRRKQCGPSTPRASRPSANGSLGALTARPPPPGTLSLGCVKGWPPPFKAMTRHLALATLLPLSPLNGSPLPG